MNSPRWTEDQLLHIFKEIANGCGKHGGFLTSFAKAMSYADPENFSMLAPSMTTIVEKYRLEKYLDNYPSTDGFPPDPEPDPGSRAA